MGKQRIEKPSFCIFDQSAGRRLRDLHVYRSSSNNTDKDAELLQTQAINDKIQRLSVASDSTGDSEPRYSCNRCPDVSLTDRNELIDHFQSSWHAYNLKLALRNRPTLNEDQYEQLMSDDELEENLASSTDSDQSDSGVQTRSQSPTSSYLQSSPFTYFQSNDTDASNILCVYRCLLNPQNLMESLSRIPNKNNWVILMIAGGHFAGAVFDGNRMVAHKTFHRYTVRAKQGTAQNAKDAANATKAPRSAGATLRRYNAQMLQEEVSSLVQSWRQSLSKADYIFVRCPSYNRPVFFHDDSPLKKDDVRLRTIPFVTKRPTIEEINRIHKMLTSVYECGSPCDLNSYCSQLRAQRQQARRAYRASRNSRNLPDLIADVESSESDEEEQTAKKKASKSAAISKQDGNEIDSNAVDNTGLTADVQQQIYTAIRTDDTSTLDHLLGSNEPFARLYLDSHRLNVTDQSLMHVAASFSCDQVLKRLLHLGVDPTVKDKDGAVPFQVSGSKSTRTVFSTFRADFIKQTGHDDGSYWNKAQIPLPPTTDQEAAAKEKEAKKRKAKKERDKVKKAQQAVVREEQREKDKFLALSDREKRALAAERRLRETQEVCTLVESRCFNCAKDIAGLTPFEYDDNRFCTVTCVKNHRAKSQTT